MWYWPPHITFGKKIIPYFIWLYSSILYILNLVVKMDENGIQFCKLHFYGSTNLNFSCLENKQSPQDFLLCQTMISDSQKLQPLRLLVVIMFSICLLQHNQPCMLRLNSSWLEQQTVQTVSGRLTLIKVQSAAPRSAKERFFLPALDFWCEFLKPERATCR